MATLITPLEAQTFLQKYGVFLLGHSLGQLDLDDWTKDFNLPGFSKISTPKTLSSIFTLVHNSVNPAKAYYPLIKLEQFVDKPLQPLKPVGDLKSEECQNYWQDFKDLYQEEMKFEAFVYLLKRFSWCLPAPEGSEGVSLYEYFKILSARRICEISSQNQKVTLVGGDVPGIQTWLYNVQAAGAARTLRGRSYYLQLLTDAIARRLLREFNLPITNILQQGGGNFTLLVPTEFGDKKASEIIGQVELEINQGLWKTDKGALACALAYKDVEDTAAFFTNSTNDFKELKQRLVRSKNTRFRSLGYTIFDPQDGGGYQETEIPTATTKEEKEKTPNYPYEQLAGKLKESFENDLTIEVSDQLSPHSDKWAEQLFAITRTAYRFHKIEKNQPVKGYQINPGSESGVLSKEGYIFIGNVTPLVNEADEKWAKENRILEARDTQIKVGDIRDLDLLASSAEGFKRYGVLRMDVDSLGAIFREGLPKPAGPALSSTLSSMLGLFFEGALNRICKDLTDKKEDVFYILYSGGDDLFILGTWSRLPELAVSIRENFAKYTGNNPELTISAGLTIAGAGKYPLYQVAYDAGAAEEKAKDFVHLNQRKKDAISFLGIELGWDEFNQAVMYKESLVSVVQKKSSSTSTPVAPKAFLTSLLDIYDQARITKRSTDTKPQLDTGRWYWRATYNFARTLNRQEKSVYLKLKPLSEDALKPEKLKIIGLAARWTHLFTRLEER